MDEGKMLMDRQAETGAEAPLAADAAAPWRVLVDDALDTDAPEAIRRYLDGGYAPDTPDGVA